MHELSVTQHILDTCLRYADQAGATRITDVYLVIGDLSSIVDDSVQFHWDFVAQGTKAEGSRLHFERVSVRLYCAECDREFSPPRGDLVCPECEGAKVRVVGGDEFRLEAIEVERD